MDAPEDEKRDEARDGLGEQLCAVCGAYWQCDCVAGDGGEVPLTKEHPSREEAAASFPTWL